jgi:cobalamin biosynthesis Mg chelatase CobN
MDDLSVLAEEVVAHSLETTRSVREVLQSMRDEGYIDCDDEGFEACVSLAETKLNTLPADLNTLD